MFIFFFALAGIFEIIFLENLKREIRFNYLMTKMLIKFKHWFDLLTSDNDDSFSMNEVMVLFLEWNALVLLITNSVFSLCKLIHILNLRFLCTYVCKWLEGFNYMNSLFGYSTLTFYFFMKYRHGSFVCMLSTCFIRNLFSFYHLCDDFVNTQIYVWGVYLDSFFWFFGIWKHLSPSSIVVFYVLIV